MALIQSQMPAKPNKGSTSITIARPGNPKINTTWRNPTSGLTETWDGKVWVRETVSDMLQASQNLYDVPNKSTARSNLGLGTLAQQNIVNFNATVALAPLTPGGSAGSLTVTQGFVTAYTAPT